MTTFAVDGIFSVGFLVFLQALLEISAMIIGLTFCFVCMCREISNHPEAYVRRSAIFAASRILIALHPSFIATALSGGDHEISRQLDWIRNWALHVAEADSDYECTVVCLMSTLAI